MDKCKKCSCELDSGIIFCPYCGVRVSGDTSEDAVCEKMTFFEAFKNHWRKAFIFLGRASVTEFWYSYIWIWIMLSVVGVIYLGGFLIGMIPLLGWIPAIILFIIATAALIFVLVPLMAVTVRRLHDTGRSAWWLVAGLVSMGIIPLVLCALKGDDDVNEYGEKPIK